MFIKLLVLILSYLLVGFIIFYLNDYKLTFFIAIFCWPIIVCLIILLYIIEFIYLVILKIKQLCG
jgi:hypothetical protein